MYIAMKKTKVGKYHTSVENSTSRCSHYILINYLNSAYHINKKMFNRLGKFQELMMRLKAN